MSEQSMIPSRKLSGRRSKPSMDLLVDNQRILLNVSESKKRRRSTIPRISNTNQTSDKTPDTSLIKNENDKKNVDHVNVTEENVNTEIPNEIKISKELYISLDLNKDTSDSNCSVPGNPEDDLPLTKVNPNIQDNQEKTKSKIELVLPPKKKIKYTDLSTIEKEVETEKVTSEPVIQLVDADLTKKKDEAQSINSKSSMKPTEVKSKSVKSSETKLKKLQNSKSLSPVKTPIPLIDVLSMPKIPKKNVVKTITNGDIPVTSDKPKLLPTNTDNSSNTTKTESSSVHEHKNKSLNQENKIPETVNQKEEAETVKENKLKTKKKHHTSSDTDVNLRCLREQCKKKATTNEQWNKEFCSAECAMLYTKQYFKNWLTHRKKKGNHV